MKKQEFHCQKCGEWFRLATNFRKHMINVHHRCNTELLIDKAVVIAALQEYFQLRIDPKIKIANFSTANQKFTITFEEVKEEESKHPG